jgi:glycerate kinase
MKLLLIPDKFKGSLTSEEVSKAFIAGVKKAGFEFTSHYIKASDGGEGFMNAVSHFKPCIFVQVISENSIGKPIQSYYIYNQETNSAYIELANASGMELLKSEERNPLLTGTFGTGLQIRDAVQKGIKNVYIGLGGSATNDGGIGIAQALGFFFLDENGIKLKAIGSSLNHIKSIDDTGVLKGLKHVKFFAINDVTNPLFGENGAAHIYAGQKGASNHMIDELDLGLKNLDKVVIDKYNLQNAKLPGSGAAGGVAYGLKTFLGANYFSGIDFILEISGVNNLLREEHFDYIITGEGKIDKQTLNGKLIQGVVALGVRENIPVIAVCGKLDIEKEQLKKIGVFDVFEIQDSSNDLGYNMNHAAGLLTAKTTEYFKLLKK